MACAWNEKHRQRALTPDDRCLWMVQRSACKSDDQVFDPVRIALRPLLTVPSRETCGYYARVRWRSPTDHFELIEQVFLNARHEPTFRRWIVRKLLLEFVEVE